MTESHSVHAIATKPAPSAHGLAEISVEEARASTPFSVAWLDAERSAALERLEANGFPTQSDEAFRFTPIRKVTRERFSKRARPEASSRDRTISVAGLDDAAVVVVNGAPVAGTTGVRTDVEVWRLADLLSADPDRVAPYLCRVARTEHGFFAQNAALFDDGLVVVANAGARGVVRIVHVAAPGAGPTLSTPRVLVVAERGSELSLVETHVVDEGALHFENSVVEIAVGEQASVEHVRVHEGATNGLAFAGLAVRQARDSRFASRTFTFGGALTRVDLRVTFEGPGAECALDGLYLAHEGEVVDHHTVIDHAEPRCSSRERYKGVIDGDALAVFDGTVFVRPGADKTFAHQENRNLLLSNDAIIHAKPHLEIDTDDVKCTHGATVGRLDQNQLFYLRSRGMDASVARALLTYAFAREMTASLADPALRGAIEASIAKRLPGGATVQELA